MAEVHVNVSVDKSGSVVVMHQPDGQGGTSSKIEGSTGDNSAGTRKISVGGTVSTCWKNPA